MCKMSVIIISLPWFYSFVVVMIWIIFIIIFIILSIIKRFSFSAPNLLIISWGVRTVDDYLKSARLVLLHSVIISASRSRSVNCCHLLVIFSLISSGRIWIVVSTIMLSIVLSPFVLNITFTINNNSTYRAGTFSSLYSFTKGIKSLLNLDSFWRGLIIGI